jgi:hypothetical protein
MDSPPTDHDPKTAKEADPASPRSEFTRTRLIPLLIVAVLAWGVFHAIGAYLFNHDIRRPLVVLACVTGFLAFWGAMLWNRSRS